jgi:hypothetical protein
MLRQAGAVFRRHALPAFAPFQLNFWFFTTKKPLLERQGLF